MASASLVHTHTHSLKIKRTDTIAVCHTRRTKFESLRRQGNQGPEILKSSKGNGVESNTKETITARQRMRQLWPYVGSSESRYVDPASWANITRAHPVCLRWCKTGWAACTPCCLLRTNSKTERQNQRIPCDSKGFTHTPPRGGMEN